MSVVACKIFKDGFEIAADSIRVTKFVQMKDFDAFSNFGKLFEINNIVIGSVGSAEERALLRIFCKTHQPEYSDEFRITDFFYEFYEWKKIKTEEFKSNNSYLIGYNNKVFYVSGLFVTEVKKYMAIGGGKEFALAVLSLDLSVDDAIKAAIEHSIYCEAPINKIVKRLDK